MQRYSKSEIDLKALRGGIIVAIPSIIAFIGYLANWLDILNFLELGKVGTLYVPFVLGLVLTILAIMVEHQNMESLGYWTKSRPVKRGQGKLIGLGKFLEVDSDGNYLTYSLS